MNVWLSGGGTHLWKVDEKTPATSWQAEIDRLMRAQLISTEQAERKRLYDRVQELVAERVLRLARVVGRERVMASSDCGFASTINPGEPPEIEPEIVWAKFESLAAGARLAIKALCG